nr:hypothetical protein L203_06480 [Cryptococcus depauperatus CBS 7841]
MSVQSREQLNDGHDSSGERHAEEENLEDTAGDTHSQLQNSDQTPAHQLLKRRPPPPQRGILKPPPPPSKPTFGNRLRDIVGGAVNTTAKLFDGPDDTAGARSSGREAEAAPPTASSSRMSAGVEGSQASQRGGLSSFGGRLALGFNRFVQPQSQQTLTPNFLSVSRQTSPSSRSAVLSEMSPASVIDDEGGKPLKKAAFVLPSLSITYPISSSCEPWSQKVVEDRQRVEDTHRQLLSTSVGPEYWTPQRLISLYETACRGREEKPRIGILRALEASLSLSMPPAPKPRILHLILQPVTPHSIGHPFEAPQQRLEIPLTRFSALALSDVLSLHIGLTSLALEEGAIESEDALKAILHGLLVSGGLTALSLKGCRKVKSGGWRMVAVFLRKAHTLKSLDLSETTWDKKSIEYLCRSLSLSSVSCGTSPQAPDSRPISPLHFHHRTASPSPTKHQLEPDSSLDSKNSQSEIEGISQHDIDPKQDKTVQDVLSKDVNDAHFKESERDPYGFFIPSAPLLKPLSPVSPQHTHLFTLRLDACGLGTKLPLLETLAHAVRSSNLRNLSLRKNKIGVAGGVAVALILRDWPDGAMSQLRSLIGLEGLNGMSASSSDTLSYLSNTSGVIGASTTGEKSQYAPKVKESHTVNSTSNTAPASNVSLSKTSTQLKEFQAEKDLPPTPASTVLESGSTPKMTQAGATSMALAKSVKALEGVERIGKLVTLDLKGNELKTGVSYIAQVLKRNRTLKILNLCSNSIPSSSLTLLAESLKYNTTLETLDLSQNPCVTPSSVLSLRVPLSINKSLKRLFLRETGVNDEGAVGLAECLDGSQSLLHLDLTENSIGRAGILALSKSLTKNTTLRCLDLSQSARISLHLTDLLHEILHYCIRNTELAASLAQQTGTSNSENTRLAEIWKPIKQSLLVKDLKKVEEQKKEKERERVIKSPEGRARKYVYTLSVERVIEESVRVSNLLQDWFNVREVWTSAGENKNDIAEKLDRLYLTCTDFATLYHHGRVLNERLMEIIQGTSETEKMEELLELNDVLRSRVEFGETFDPPKRRVRRVLLPSEIVPTLSSSSLEEPRQHLSPSPSYSGSPRTSYQSAYNHAKVSSLEISSPNFSIGDSDNDSDAEELDVGSLARRSHSTRATSVSAFSIDEIATDMTKKGPKNDEPDSALPDESMQREIERGLMEAQENMKFPPVSSLTLDAQNLSQVQETTGKELISPVEKTSRMWLEEEGEIFRKGVKLGVVDDLEHEVGKAGEGVSGEELKQEILKTPVVRTTKRVIPVEEGGDRGENDEDFKDEVIEKEKGDSD